MKSLGFISLLGSALALAACAGIATDNVASAEQQMNPTDRLFVGQANPYPADLTLRDRLPTLKASQASRRSAAWEIAKRVL